MSLKDRLKTKKPHIVKKQTAPAAENKFETKQYIDEAQGKILLALQKKIASTSRWDTYTLKKQEEFVANFVKEQLNNEFSSLNINEDVTSKIIKEIILSIRDFGILEKLLNDGEISYIMANGANDIYVEKNQKLLKANLSFKSAEEFKQLVYDIAMNSGYNLSEKNPILDFCHKRGYHINILVPPVVHEEPCITIKKLNRKLCKLEDLYEQKSLSLEMTKVMEAAVTSGANILVCGLKESGKTTILNGLCNKIPQSERTVLIEDSEELILKQKNIVRLRTRPVNDMKDVYQVTASNLIKNAIRMRPDRIVLGECAGDEAGELLKSMKLGYFGLITTIYSESVLDAIKRMEEFIHNYLYLSQDTVRENLANFVDLIICIKKMPNGERKIVKISEPFLQEEGEVSVRDIFVYDKQIEDEKIVYEHISTGVVPRFLNKAREKGVKINNIIFDTKYAHTYP